MTVPITVSNGLAYMHARVNGSRDLEFMLDTGSAMTFVSTSVAAQLGLKSHRTAQPLTGITGSIEPLDVVNDASLQWGNAENVANLKHRQLGLAPMGFIAAVLHHTTDGTLGSDVFKTYRTTIDYARGTAMFVEPSSNDYSPSDTVLPLEIFSGVPFTELRLAVGERKSIPAIFLLDSGMEAALSINSLFLSHHPQIAQRRWKVGGVVATDAGGSLRGFAVRLRGLIVPGVPFKNSLALVPQSTHWPFSDPNVAGSIGAGFLSRFTTTWDYPHGLLYLTLNK